VVGTSIQPKVFAYLASLEWLRAQRNLAITGPNGTGKSHTLVGLGIAAIQAGHKVRYFTAADLVEALYHGLADNTVGKIAESLLRVDLIILDLSRPCNYADPAAAWLVFCNPLDDGQRQCPGCGSDGIYRDTVIRTVTDVPMVGHPLGRRAREPR